MDDPRLAALGRTLAGHTPETWPREEGELEAAVTAVLRPGETADGSLELLLIERVERTEDPWSGHIALPGGRREQGDPDLLTTAFRETAEEAGVYVRPKGLLRIEHSWGVAGGTGYTRFRFVFLAHPVGSAEPKAFADEHSLEARWVSLDELDQYDLRGPDVVELFTLAASGAPLLPIEAYVTEGGG